ncbi:MAG: hypothetical protein KF883_04235 [Thermomicrobiales bacterium]|nr:hypothetical protein [Thermomicrobiales bacterium]
MNRARFTLMVALGALLSLALGPVSGVQAQTGGQLIIGVSQCPEGYTGTDYAVDCVEPAAGVDFYIGTPNSDNVESTTSGGDGLATFSLEPFDLDPEGPDTVSVGEPVVEGGDYAVGCSTGDGEPIELAFETLPFEPGGPLFGVTFDFDAGADIACQWFRLSPPPAGGGDPPVDDDPIGQLPNTGAGSQQTAAPDVMSSAVAAMIVLLSASAAALAIGASMRRSALRSR